MSKASESALGELHRVVAEGLTACIAEGVAVVVTRKDADGEKETVLEKAPAGAAYYAAAIALLKNNNITADPEKNDALEALRETLANKRKDGKAGMKSLDDAVAAFSERMPMQ